MRTPNVPLLLALLLLHPTATASPAAVAPLSAVAPPERLGPVWPIVERDMRQVILERLHAKLPEIRERLKDNLASYRVPSIAKPTTTLARSVVIDPSITLSADLVSHDGRILAKEGARVNPLSILPLRRTYLILDAADDRQVKWAAKELAAMGSAPATVLLTDGSLEATREHLPTTTKLFPAPPALFARLPIDSVPARLRRESDRIRIDYIPERELPE